MKKQSNHRRIIGFPGLAAVAAAIAMLGSPAAAISSNANTPGAVKTTSKDAIKEDVTPVRPMAMKNKFGGYSNVGVKAANVFKNQRQYRKHVRSNPWLLNSKKHRSKN
jgi:hypothetical protein